MLTKEQKEFIESCLSKGDEYTINDIDGSVSIEGNFSISNNEITEIPVKIEKVTGFLSIGCNKLKSLKGAPDIVYGFVVVLPSGDVCDMESLEWKPNMIGGGLLINLDKCKDEFLPRLIEDMDDILESGIPLLGLPITKENPIFDYHRFKQQYYERKMIELL